MSYQGWKNWETWNVVLWVGNDEATYKACEREKTTRGLFNADSARIFVEHRYPSGTPDIEAAAIRDGSPKTGMGLKRAVSAMYDKVDWQAVARSFNEE